VTRVAAVETPAYFGIYQAMGKFGTSKAVEISSDPITGPDLRLLVPRNNDPAMQHRRVFVCSKISIIH
jgi:hypothetical protein